MSNLINSRSASAAYERAQPGQIPEPEPPPPMPGPFPPDVEPEPEPPMPEPPLD
jgi:hypothetical protein